MITKNNNNNYPVPGTIYLTYETHTGVDVPTMIFIEQPSVNFNFCPTQRVACGVSRCPKNANGMCKEPYAVRIDPKGYCEESVPYVYNQKARMTFCRACGLPILKDTEGKWRHLGVALPHPPSPPVRVRTQNRKSKGVDKPQ